MVLGTGRKRYKNPIMTEFGILSKGRGRILDRRVARRYSVRKRTFPIRILEGVFTSARYLPALSGWTLGLPALSRGLSRKGSDDGHSREPWTCSMAQAPLSSTVLDLLAKCWRQSTRGLRRPPTRVRLTDVGRRKPACLLLPSSRVLMQLGPSRGFFAFIFSKMWYTVEN